MSKRVAIHKKFSGSWWQQWQACCEARGVSYAFVDCYQPNIMAVLKGFDVLLWNFNQAVAPDMLEARSILYSASKLGLQVFPDFDTAWHFDDKVAQSYLLQAVGAPIAPYWVFYDRQQALDWLERDAALPLVAKLRAGAGSQNVKLLSTRASARRYTKTMFGRGYSAAPKYFPDLKHNLRRSGGWAGRIARIKKVPRYWRKLRRATHLARERGYVYFQKFIPDNTHDVRVSVVGNRAWGFTRGVRAGDFRASGSGMIDYDLSRVSLPLVEQSFEIVKALGTQSLCLDYVQDADGKAWLVEVSYGFVGEAVYDAPGYWDSSLEWHEGHFYPEHAILEDLLATPDDDNNG